MRNFLNQQDSTFYRIVRKIHLDSVLKHGISGDSQGRIFVIRTAEFPVICEVFCGQIVNIGEENVELSLLKLPQALNNFLPHEITRDYQSNEWSMPLQHIILRKHIPPENIEVMMNFTMNVNQANQIMMTAGMEYPNHIIYQNALNTIYEDVDGNRFRLNPNDRQGNLIPV